MTAECSYGIEYPKFSDIGADEIRLSIENPFAVSLFVHPDRAPKDDLEELRTAFHVFTAAAISALEEIRCFYPDAAAKIEKEKKLPEEYFPITSIYAEIPDTEISPCNSCGKFKNGVCTSEKLCRAVSP